MRSVAGNQTDVNAEVDREYAEAWRPEPGDKLIGEVVELSQRDGEFGSYPIITIKQGNGEELALHAFHTVAQNELARVRPQVGETAAIKYIGKRTAQDGRTTFHAYRVAVDRPAPPFNWAKYSDDVEPPGGGDVERVGGSDVPADDFAGAAAAKQEEDTDVPF